MGNCLEVILHVKMKIIFLIMFLLLIPLINADTTFFDNPDDFFVVTDSATSEITGEIIEEIAERGSNGGCLYKWNCTSWGECLSSGKQTRNCINIGTCPDTYKFPEVEQNCIYIEKVEGDKWLGKENIIETLIYLVIILITLFIIFYLEKDYFKKVITKI